MGFSSEEFCFLGEFEHALDSQRRLAVPSDWRLKDVDPRFILLPAKSSIIQVIPFKTFNEVILNKAKRLSLANANDVRDLAVLGSRAQVCACDKQGRIQISPKLMEHARLKDKAILIGSLWHIQLWAPDAWAGAQGAGEGFFDVIQKISEAPDELANIVRGALGGPK